MQLSRAQLLALQCAAKTGYQADIRLGTSGEKRVSACILCCASTFVLAYSRLTQALGTERESLPLFVQNLEFLNYYYVATWPKCPYKLGGYSLHFFWMGVCILLIILFGMRPLLNRGLRRTRFHRSSVPRQDGSFLYFPPFLPFSLCYGILALHYT